MNSSMLIALLFKHLYNKEAIDHKLSFQIGIDNSQLIIVILNIVSNCVRVLSARHLENCHLVK